jgi:hypothetical protein
MNIVPPESIQHKAAVHVLRRKAFYHNFSAFARLRRHPFDDLLNYVL